MAYLRHPVGLNCMFWQRQNKAGSTGVGGDRHFSLMGSDNRFHNRQANTATFSFTLP
jgi:uncharacterized protein YcbX